MTAWPIIERELRTQARLGFTYGMRVAGAVIMLLVWLYYGFNSDFPPQLGGWLFGYLNCTLFISIWIVVPLLAADCISAERREGTLGLLFLTPLKSREIVLAKGLVHGMRALTLWLATLPILTIPFLVGGVTWREALLSAMINFSAICWALAAGLVGSSAAKAWARAQLFACLFGIVFGVAFVCLTGAHVLLQLGGGSRFGLDFYDRMLVIGLFGATDAGGWWGRILSSFAGRRLWSFFIGESGLVLVSVLALSAAVGVAAWNLRRTWQESPPSARQLWLHDKFCTPVIWVSFFRRWMRRKLERNPIGWLEQRTWSGRLVTWGWFAVMISLYSAALNGLNIGRLLDTLQEFMAWLLLGVMSVSAAGSFQRERETGVLELLLVSPLSERQIIGGRLRGLWGQFVPALFILLGIWIYLGNLPARDLSDDWKWMAFFCAAFAAVPIIGLYCSLRYRNFIISFFFTLFFGLALPFGLNTLLDVLARLILRGLGLFSFPYRYASTGSILLNGLLLLTDSIWPVILIQALIAVRLGRRLYRDLASRNFAFSKGGT